MHWSFNGEKVHLFSLWPITLHRKQVFFPTKIDWDTHLVFRFSVNVLIDDVFVKESVTWVIVQSISSWRFVVLVVVVVAGKSVKKSGETEGSCVA